MKYVTQFQPGQWWISEDGRLWKRLRGPIARQLVTGFQLLQGAAEMLADSNDEVYFLQAQLVENPKEIPVSIKKVLRKVPQKKPRPISDNEIKLFAQSLSRRELFPKTGK